MSFSRRTLLRSGAATLFLPFLPSALPSSARAATGASPKRLLFWFVPNGILYDHFRPATEGTDYELTRVLEPIAPLKHRMTPLSGILNGITEASGFGTHEQSLASLLTDVDIDRNGNLDASNSLDQFLAGSLGNPTPFPSMQLGSGEPYINSVGSLDTYYSTISWASASSPLANLVSPKVLFDRMFAGADSALTAAEQAKRDQLRTSVLDVVLERSNQLASRLSAADKRKLDQYQTGVRELEVRIQQLQDLQCARPLEPGSNLDMPETVSQMSDLMALAFECDLTRIITWMAGATTAESVYDFLGISTTHHNLSHDWAFDDASRQELLTIQAWQMEMFTALAQKLADRSDGAGGDLLQHTAMVLCTEFGDSNLHDATPLPFVVAGGEASGWVQGKHRATGGAPHSNLLLTLADHMGVDASDWARTATGPADLSS